MESQRQQNTSAVETQATVRAPAAAVTTATTWTPLNVRTSATAETLAWLGHCNSMNVTAAKPSTGETQTTMRGHQQQQGCYQQQGTSNSRDTRKAGTPATAGTPVVAGKWDTDGTPTIL
jgi:hypothetical protein